MLAFQVKSPEKSVPIMKFEQIVPLFSNTSDTTYFVNFFATWCAPCLKEIPDFIAFADSHRNEKCKVIYICLDNKKDTAKSIYPALKKMELNDNVYILNEGEGGVWMDAVWPCWSGALPAIKVINQKNNLFNFSEFTLSRQELEDLFRLSKIVKK
jgi:thiol-disulfide isomerase/thioredoxin